MKTSQKSPDPNWIGNEDDDIYKENILDHYKHPHNLGSMEKPTFSSKGNNPLCGDNIEIFIELNGNKVKEVKFRGSGCAISMASASMLTDRIKGMDINQVKNLQDKDIFKMIGANLGVVRAKCGLLGLQTLVKGIDEYGRKINGKK